MTSRSALESAASWVQDRTRDALLRASGAGSSPGLRRAREPLRFLFTIDTEISMGGALRDPSLSPVGPEQRIWGETEQGRAGIDLFMDVFDEFGLRGVFFFEVCGRNVVDEASLAEAARHIHQRGHDVELHVHPEFRMDIEKVRAGEADKPSAFLFEYPWEARLRLLRTTAERIEAWTGRRPSAFRAGGFASDEGTLAALAALGIPYDSSYSLWSVGLNTCRYRCDPPLNDVALMDHGRVQVPITCYQAAGPRGGLRQFDLASLSAAEAIAVLEQLYAAGTRVCTSLTHSFRLVKTTDIQYGDARPDGFNIRRLHALCRFLAENPDRFQVCTYRDLPLEQWQRELANERRSQPFLPTPPTWTSLARLAVQAIKDRGVI